MLFAYLSLALATTEMAVRTLMDNGSKVKFTDPNQSNVTEHKNAKTMYISIYLYISCAL
jgi:hypothetical protein